MLMSFEMQYAMPIDEICRVVTQCRLLQHLAVKATFKGIESEVAPVQWHYRGNRNPARAVPQDPVMQRVASSFMRGLRSLTNLKELSLGFHETLESLEVPMLQSPPYMGKGPAGLNMIIEWLCGSQDYER
ncbi:hypothetical protein BGZ92_010740 [Podila epicladia]|nr:hypothetical protein BGZ92_010740 [Podila epicladia]